ncbi:MAG: hypothetical protein HRU04_10395 [Oceanospirillaceae bacterium]|nr:hypothetical protein [Oceanospirillaceae bacterium]
MKFGIAIESDADTEKSIGLVLWISQRLEKFFETKDYGDGIGLYVIGFICVRPVTGYDEWFKPRSPRYVFKNGTYTYDVMLTQEKIEAFINSSEKEAFEIIFETLVDSLSYLDKRPKKLTNFDVSRFKSDFIGHLRELIESNRFKRYR